jgi:DNA-binding MurR/RpiR family transcriptional regulator
MVVDHGAKAGATIVLVTETLGVALRERVNVVLATPTTITGTSDGVVMGMIVARALHLSVATHDQANAVHTMERLNALRAEIVGGKLDADD